jgi:glucosamine-6-phosphate deaminase
LAEKIKENNRSGKNTTAILPVSPLDYSVLAKICNDENINLGHFCIINMDDMLDDDLKPISPDNGLSFSAFMERTFYNIIRKDLNMPVENRIMPGPNDLGKVQRKINQMGGVDVCYAGIGVSGHIAFNEPCEPGEVPAGTDFIDLPTRVLRLTEASRAQLALGSGGDLWSVQRYAITIGMKEIMQAKELHVMGLRSWHPGPFRRAMYGEVTPRYPASYMQKHPNLCATLIEHVINTPRLLPE